MSDAVVDSSVVLAYLLSEPGADEAERLLPGALVSCVNAAEIVAKLIDNHRHPDLARAVVDSLGVEIVDAGSELALEAGAMRANSRHLGLSLGDRFCLALGRLKGLPVYTADRRWKDFASDLDIRLIR